MAGLLFRLHYQSSDSSEPLSSPWTCKEISQHVLTAHVIDHECSVFNELLNEEILDVDVSGVG